MFLSYAAQMVTFIKNMVFLYTNFFAICISSLYYIVVGAMLCVISFVLEHINSMKHPLVIRYRRLVRRYFRIFRNKSCRKFGYDEDAIRKGDSYIDELLKDMFENNVDEYDPYVMEDSVVGFNRKVMFVNVTGEAKLYDGNIKGLSTLHRASHCSLHNEGEKLKVKADLGAGELEFHYKGSAKFMNFGPTITVEGSLSYIEVHMEFEVNANTGREGKLTKFIIDDMRGMKVRVTGLGPINWAVNPIISGVTKIFQKFVRKFMENKVEKYIRERIPNYQFPVDGEITEIPETNPPETKEPVETTPDTLIPETEAPEETPEPEPETEAPEETPEPEPETEAPEETSEPEPETEAPEETPETVTPEPESETEAPEETPEPEPESDVSDIISEPDTENEAVEMKPNIVEDTILPETPDSSDADETDSDETEDGNDTEESGSESSKET